MCLETLVLLVPFGIHLMYTKNLDCRGGGVRKESGVVCSGVILQSDSSQASDASVPPGVV